MSRNRTMITAHSGCDHTKDNSLEFVNYALFLPIDAFEVDVRKNGRGELVLSHDAAPEDAPLLSEVFSRLTKHPEKKINCDLKQPGLEATVVTLAEQHGVDRQLIFTGTVDQSLFRKGSVQFPQVAWYANIDTLMPEYDARAKSVGTTEQKKMRLEQLLLQMQDYETAGLNWHYGDAELVWEKARLLGIGISVWTVNDSALQRLWLARKADNITSRQIAQLLALRETVQSCKAFQEEERP